MLTSRSRCAAKEAIPMPARHSNSAKAREGKPKGKGGRKRALSFTVQALTRGGSHCTNYSKITSRLHVQHGCISQGAREIRSRYRGSVSCRSLLLVPQNDMLFSPCALFASLKLGEWKRGNEEAHCGGTRRNAMNPCAREGRERIV